MKAAPPPPLAFTENLCKRKKMTNMKDKITDTWTFKLNTVFQIGFSSLVEESFSSVSRNILNKQNSSEEKPDLYVDQDQQYF